MFNLTKKINARNSLFALSLTALGLLIVPNSAQAANLVSNTNFSDADFRSLIDNGDFSELFVAEGRIGDSARGTRQYKELKINGDVANGAPVSEETQFNWGNGETYDFSLEYDGSTVTYVVDGVTLTSNDFGDSVNNIFFRTSAWENTTTSLTNLVFNGTTIGDVTSDAVGGRDIDYLQINDISSPFTITGKAAMSWDATNARPKDSQSAFQIKVGNSPTPTSVPEPGTIGAIFITGLTGFGLSKKKQKNQV
ncbi:MAG: PEP-CTERM sorting domain-containing protein [Rivularia sp. ALOHA_DT_140]|nr:PEP-CTERM sorting domain-containing protein [Rivularia sp. ALOHA_DT_140]